MKKANFALSVIILVLAFAFNHPVKADEPCTDGQVPIGSKCLIGTLPMDPKTDEKDDSVFGKLIEWFHSFDF